MSLAQTTRHLASRGKPTQFPVFVYWVADPLKLGVTTNGLVEWVDQDDLVELVRGVLGYPVGAKHTQATAFLSNTFLYKKKNTSKLLSISTFEITVANLTFLSSCI